MGAILIIRDLCSPSFLPPAFTLARLVTRTSGRQLSLEIEIAGLNRAKEIADAIREGLEDIKVTRVALGKENGRIAHIFFKDRTGGLNAVMTDVTESSTPESLLSSALL